MERITSRDNPRWKRLHGLLTRRSHREESGLFVCEGLRLCRDAMESGVPALEAWVTPQAVERHSGLETLCGRAERAYEIPAHLAEKLSDTPSPQGIFLLCRKLDNGETAVKIENGRKYLALASLQDPGNVGTIIRTAEALGVDGLILTRDCPDLYGPKVLRSSMGGVFRLPIRVCGDMARELAALREEGVETFAAALGGNPEGLNRLGSAHTSAVLVGNEGNGLPSGLVEACDHVVTIPMAGGAESLNAGVAASLLMWEMTKRRLGAEG